MEVKMKYKDIGKFEFASLISKIANTPTTNKNACHINKIVKELTRIRQEISETYTKEVMEVYAKRDERGEIIRPADEPKGMELMEGKEEEFNKALADFGEKEATISWKPLTPTALADVKMSATEISLLGDLFSEEEGPGVPHMHALSSEH